VVDLRANSPGLPKAKEKVLIHMGPGPHHGLSAHGYRPRRPLKLVWKGSGP